MIFTYSTTGRFQLDSVGASPTAAMELMITTRLTDRLFGINKKLLVRHETHPNLRTLSKMPTVPATAGLMTTRFMSARRYLMLGEGEGMLTFWGA
jgi:hypothetical protein